MNNRHSLRGLCGLKLYKEKAMQITFWSQPARAVWIEIQNIEVEFETSFVTACEGCVD